MTISINFDRRALDLLEEETFGPPPRFLLEDRPSVIDAGELEPADERDDGLSALDKVKSFLGIL